MNKLQSIAHPTLVLIRGVPGSGKTYLATALKEAIGNDRVVTPDPDVTDYKSEEYAAHSKALVAEGVDLKFHPYRFVRAQAYKGIVEHKIIIWNQPFTSLDGFTKTVKNLQTYAKDHGTHLPLLVVEVEVNHETAKKRVMDRKKQGGHGPSETTFGRFINDYETFAGKGYDTIVVNGEDEVAVSVATVINALRERLDVK